MKWIWSIGNKINDGHKALAVLTLNNLSFDASLLLLHDAPSVFTTLCSNSRRVKMEMATFLFFCCLMKVFTSNTLIATYIACYMYLMVNGLTSEVHKGTFCSTWSMETFNQPWEFAVAWKAAESFTLQLPALFQMFFLPWNDAPVCTLEAWNFKSRETDLGCWNHLLSKSDRGQWMELSKEKEWWKKTSSRLSFVSFCRSFVLSTYFAHCSDCLRATTGNTSGEQFISDCRVDEPFSCPDGRLKMLPSEGCRQILVETSAPLCCNLKMARDHLVTVERGCCSADRMMYHLVRVNDNFISHLHFRCKILPAHFSMATFKWTPTSHKLMSEQVCNQNTDIILWQMTAHGKKQRQTHCELCLSKAEVIFCKRDSGITTDGLCLGIYDEACNSHPNGRRHDHLGHCRSEGEKGREGKSSIMEKGAPVCCSSPGQSWELPDALYD